MDASPLIEIFKAGRFTSAEGETHDFSEAQLQAAVDAYDRAVDAAPLVIGHPDLDAPAYGWVKSLSLEGGVILAEAENVAPSFAEAVRQRAYRKVSASWYPADHPENPKPGALYLKHVGFLGAAPPAVKGLRPVAFSAAQAAGCLTTETIIEGRSMEKTEEEAKALSFAEREATLAAKEAELAEREKKLADEARAARHAANLSFAEQQFDGGKLSKPGVQLVTGILDQLDAAKPMSFGEANGELTPAAAFRKLFDSAARIVSFGEHAKREEDDGKGEDPVVIAAKARSYAEEQAKAGTIITMAAAVRHVRKAG